ncbi:hypothetical protein [Rhizobium leguminosarum]|uniref:hypothetical protein n=1 Tax=Rhizobium leguminosarum TaxID=384 RepID=UPI001C989E2C|nr:hypothetical protein [Rhizobium leguminosarum]MBY5700543.1 hypothetical protein [Rhizobium leguminosarum]
MNQIEAILSGARVRQEAHIYYLPPVETALDIAVAQAAALNLVAALKQSNALKRGDVAAVIGGNVSFMTVVAALMEIGCNVQLFTNERSTGPETNASHRFAHPTLGAWPSHNLSDTTQFPLLDWYAGSVADVYRTLKEQADPYLRRVERRSLRSVREITKTADGDLIIRSEQGETNAKTVILVDPGAEEPANRAYWQVDSLDTEAEDLDTNFVVFGSGDAALVDLLRIVHQDFKIGRLALDVVNALDHAPFATEMIKKAEVILGEGTSDGEAVAKLYFEAAGVIDEQPVGHHLRGSLKYGAKIFLVSGSKKAPFVSASAPIHKLMAAHAIRNAAVRQLVGAPEIQNGVCHVGATQFPMDKTRLIIRASVATGLRALITQEELETLRYRRQMGPGGVTLWDTPNRSAEDIVSDRAGQQDDYAANSFNMGIRVTDQGFVLTGEAGDKVLPTQIFGAPVYVDIENEASPMHGNSVVLVPALKHNSRHHWANEATSGTRLARLAAARRMVATKARSTSVSHTCDRILSFIESATPKDLRYMTVESLAEAADMTALDTDLFKAISLLASTGIDILPPRLMFVDDDDLQTELSLTEFEIARQSGTLKHPRTGTLVADFEHYVVPFFTLGPRLSGANA